MRVSQSSNNKKWGITGRPSIFFAKQAVKGLALFPGRLGDNCSWYPYFKSLDAVELTVLKYVGCTTRVCKNEDA